MNKHIENGLDFLHKVNTHLPADGKATICGGAVTDFLFDCPNTKDIDIFVPNIDNLPFGMGEFVDFFLLGKNTYIYSPIYSLKDVKDIPYFLNVSGQNQKLEHKGTKIDLVFSPQKNTELVLKEFNLNITQCSLDENEKVFALNQQDMLSDKYKISFTDSFLLEVDKYIVNDSFYFQYMFLPKVSICIKKMEKYKKEFGPPTSLLSHIKSKRLKAFFLNKEIYADIKIVPDSSTIKTGIGPFFVGATPSSSFTTQSSSFTTQSSSSTTQPPSSW